MSARRYRRLLVTAMSCLLLVAVATCRDATTATIPSPTIKPARSVAPPHLPAPAVPSQLEVARAVPGFGGYYIGPDGRPTVYLADYARRPAAEQALGGVLAQRGMKGTDLRVVRARYGYAQLDTWYRQARPSLFQIEGVVLGDVDEGRNRVRIGVATPAADARVHAELARLGVPAGAVDVEYHPSFSTLYTLRDRVRPLQGGLQINFFPTPAGTPGPSLICTLGFNVELHGKMSFITNSHCSNVEGSSELPTQYYQSLRSGASNYIGIEASDPQWRLLLSLDCPPPLSCRYSDAARVQYEPGVDVRLGRIAQLDELTTSLADTTHNILGEFQIVSERLDPFQGEIVNKVGRTTGWTAGVTTGTCVDVLALGTTHMRLCQATVAALVDGGDSGSPVFFVNGGNEVTLLGILWDGSTDEARPEFVYSPLSGVRRELGNFRTF